MLLKDQPTLKDVAKVFIVGLALRSYVTDGSGNGNQRRTSFGHELSRRICNATNRSSTICQRHRQKFLTLERIKDYDMQYKEKIDLSRQTRELMANNNLTS
ncbi:uncharacterized protein LOC6565746 [Drosophila grimshawi]|uniref:GH24673 n=1 Tax=Drosophila grimshawi TaxID=7222 RepID=B4JMQ8_DROGR|nr:uncharacterized protein LOC6565746 [Drosophila grimshawi]EDV92001.1 GH24673 [Drosophila grimshawi]